MTFTTKVYCPEKVLVLCPEYVWSPREKFGGEFTIHNVTLRAVGHTYEFVRGWGWRGTLIEEGERAMLTNMLTEEN